VRERELSPHLARAPQFEVLMDEMRHLRDLYEFMYLVATAPLPNEVEDPYA
jgi:hypothetical protein